MADIGEREYYTVAQAAQVLEVSRTTVWRWIDEGRLAAYRLGGRTIRIKRGDLRSLLKPARERRREVRFPLEPREHDQEGRQTDIWADYNPETVKTALRESAGVLASVDRRTLLQDIREGREQASQGRP
jgi:excisionase family DNA binding protein